jgi:hypothetical protein
MMTERPPVEGPGPRGGEGGPGPRAHRQRRRRRLVREELLAVAVLLAVLAVTVAVLATQWLASGPSANAGPVPAITHPTGYGGTT